jgi:hypothetical protein
LPSKTTARPSKVTRKSKAQSAVLASA